ncbi:MAG: phosphoribosylaminoimidazolesuccinocarboxamide synthase [Phycisphaerales bacterium]|nr:phosphoribosylaminoimidazolesuccinocarboxamide synthase [Phycisphaerales bacterium]
MAAEPPLSQPVAVGPRPVVATDLALPNKRTGKVRDVYDLPADALGPRLLIVATDRISAFDVVMPTPIDAKGKLLTELSTFWLRLIEARGVCRTHLISTDASEVPAPAFTGSTNRTDLVGRVTIARKARVIPIECVVRGYLEGSGWKEYQASGRVCGVALPPGLRQCDRLPQPIFTPATKEDFGKHDENISFERAADLVGVAVMERLRALSIAIYTLAAEHAARRGILLADTKFEFGFPIGPDGREGPDPILVDEALTPDSSRFWPADRYAPGGPQPSFDKQFLREYLEGLVAKGAWGKQAPGPSLPPEVVARTVDKYRRARDLLVDA